MTKEITVPLENVRLRLEAVHASLTPAEKRLNGYLLHNIDSVIHLTITELAREAEVSVATVTRLCQNCGYRGYTQLRILLAKDRVVIPPSGEGGELEVSDEINVICNKLTAACQQSLSDTRLMLDNDVLLQSAALIANASRVDLYGIGGSATVAVDIRHKLLKLGVAVSAWSDNDLMLISSAGLSTRDLAIGVSHTGRSEPVVAALQSARDAGAKTLALTHNPLSPIAQAADLVLNYSAKTTVFSSDSMTGRLSQLLIADILYTIIGYSHFERSAPRVDRANELASRRRIN